MQEKIKLPSNRNFGIVFSIFFMIVALWPLLNQDELRMWSLLISIGFLFLGLINSIILSPLNKVWFKFGLILGIFIAPIVMGIIFFLVVTPTGMIMKALGKDLLKLKKNKNNTYWLDKDNSNNSMKNQF